MQANLGKYCHIIWDWNGTLMNDAWLCVEIVNRLLKKRFLPTIDNARYTETFDLPVIDFYRRIGFDFSAEPFETVAAEFIGDYDKLRFGCNLQDGAVTILKSCCKAGLTQSVLSAYQQHRLNEMVDFYDISSLFTRVLGLDDHYAAGKIENGRKMIKELGLDPARTLLIGDMVHDFEVANAVGVDCILIPSGHQPRQKLLSCGAAVFNSLTQFFSLAG